MHIRSNDKCFYVDIMSASPEVTGSCLYCTVKYPDRSFEHFIVDCGLFQEPTQVKYNSELLFTPSEVDFALVTHNHIDHIGRFPLLTKNGYNSPIYATEDAKLLMPIALADTLSILNSNAKKNSTSPLYSSKDVETVAELTKGVPYSSTVQVSDNIKVTFFKNGHLVGAALILVQISYYKHNTINLLFSGDYNDANVFYRVPRLPKLIRNLPLTVICESTYGYMDSSEIVRQFDRDLISFFSKCPNGTVLLPVFSLGRSQEILQRLKFLQESGFLKDIPIYLDGKLTLRYTALFEAHVLSSIDEDKLEFVPRNLEFVSKDMRLALCSNKTAKIIVSSSGMGSYGPSQTYIRELLSQKDSLIYFTGYAAEGTIARSLFDAESDSIVEFGKLQFVKKAEIKFTNEFSAHAKADELLDFLRSFKDLKLVLVTHGQKQVKTQFAEKVRDEIDSNEVEILSRDYFFRINSNGLMKTLTTHFN